MSAYKQPGKRRSGSFATQTASKPRIKQFVRLVGATAVKDAGPKCRLISVCLEKDGGSRRLLLPNSQTEVHADGAVYATRWILKEKNDELNGDAIQVDLDDGYAV